MSMVTQTAQTSKSSIADAPLFTAKNPERTIDFIKEGFVRLTAAQAAIIAQECRYWNQHRDKTQVGEAHKKVLADIMRRDQWRPREKIDFARVGGKLVMVNGHHRVPAQAASGKTIEWVIVIHECADEAAVDALYCTFDTNQRTRGTANVLDAIGLAEMIGCKKETARWLYDAVPLIHSGFNFEKTGRDYVFDRAVDLRVDYCKSFQGPILDWEHSVKHATSPVRRRLATQASLSVALIAFKYQPDIAKEFWGGVARDNGLMKGDPRHTYLKYLRFETRENEALSMHFAPALYAALAWNAWFETRHISILKAYEGASLRIAGTPVGRG